MPSVRTLGQFTEMYENYRMALRDCCSQNKWFLCLKRNHSISGYDQQGNDNVSYIIYLHLYCDPRIWFLRTLFWKLWLLQVVSCLMLIFKLGCTPYLALIDNPVGYQSSCFIQNPAGYKIWDSFQTLKSSFKVALLSVLLCDFC